MSWAGSKSVKVAVEMTDSCRSQGQEKISFGSDVQISLLKCQGRIAALDSFVTRVSYVMMGSVSLFSRDCEVEQS